MREKPFPTVAKEGVKKEPRRGFWFRGKGKSVGRAAYNQPGKVGKRSMLKKEMGAEGNQKRLPLREKRGLRKKGFSPNARWGKKKRSSPRGGRYGLGKERKEAQRDRREALNKREAAG